MSSSSSPKKSARTTNAAPRKRPVPAAKQAKSKSEKRDVSPTADIDANKIPPAVEMSEEVQSKEYVMPKFVPQKSVLPAAFLQETAPTQTEVDAPKEPEASEPPVAAEVTRPAPLEEARVEKLDEVLVTTAASSLASDTAQSAQRPLVLDFVRAKQKWIIGALAGSIALGYTVKAFNSEKKAKQQAEEIVTAQQVDQLRRLNAMAREAALLSDSTNTLGLETQVTQGLMELPKSMLSPERVETHLQLSGMAWRRSDLTLALAQASMAHDMAVLAKQPLGQAQAQVAKASVMIHSGPNAEAGKPWLAEATQLVAPLPTTPEKTILDVQIAILNATIASRSATELTDDDKLRRETDLARLKDSGKKLSTQLRAELEGETQKREKLQQEASATNDPAKMAQATAAKEAFDKKFDEELKNREAKLTQETTEAAKPRPEISDVQMAATTAWRTTVAAAEASGDKLLAAEAKLGLVSALLLEQNLPEALALVQSVLKTESLPSRIVTLSQELNARVELQGSRRKSGDAAKAAQTVALQSASEAAQALERQSFRSAQAAFHLADCYSLMAEACALLGQAEVAAKHRESSSKIAQSAARDGGWNEVLQQSNQTISQLSQALKNGYSDELAAQLKTAVEFRKSMQSWYGAFLVKAPAETSAEAANRAKEIAKQFPDQFPWAALMEKLGV